MRSLHVFIKPVKVWWQYAFITTIKAIIDRYKLSTLLFYLKGMFLIFERVMQYNLVWGSLRLIVVYEKRKLFQTRLCKYNLLKKLTDSFFIYQ